MEGAADNAGIVCRDIVEELSVGIEALGLEVVEVCVLLHVARCFVMMMLLSVLMMLIVVLLPMMLLLVLLLVNVVGPYGGGDGIGSRGLDSLSVGLSCRILQGLGLLGSEAILGCVGCGLENLEAVARVRVDAGLVLLRGRLGLWWG